MFSCKLYPVLHLAPPPARPSVPLTSGHLSCTDTFAWSRGCPFMTGTTVVGKRYAPAQNMENANGLIIGCTFLSAY